MKGSFLFTVFFLFAVSTVQAQDNPSRFELHSDEVLRGNFVQKRNIKGFGRPLKSEGNFVISPRKGLIWNVKTPFPITTIITPSGFVQNSNGIKTMSLSAQKMPFISRIYDMVSGVLTGKWKTLQETFAIQGNLKTMPWQIVLTPLKTKDPFLPFREINVSGAQFVGEVIMVKPDGDTDVLSFSDVSSVQSPLSLEELDFFALGDQ